MKDGSKCITFSKTTGSHGRWRLSASFFGIVFTISNTPVRFRNWRSVINAEEKDRRIKLRLMAERGYRCEMCGKTRKVK